MERILRRISNKEMLIVLLLIALMLACIANLIQQSKASHGKSNNIFQDNGSTSDINGNNIILSDTNKTTSSNIITKVIGNDQVSGSGSGYSREISDKICGNSSARSNIQTTATLSGKCGQGVTIELNANDGEGGTFTGNADWTVNRHSMPQLFRHW